MGYLLTLLVAVMSSSSTVLRKNYINRTLNVKSSINIFMLVAHPIAAVYFFILSKGNVTIDSNSFFFAFLYGIICMSSVLVNLHALTRANLVYIGVLGGAGSTIIPFLFDLLRGNAFTVFQVIAVAIRLKAVLLPMFQEKKKTKGFILYIFIFIISGLGSIINKLYGEHSTSVSDSSYCFWTNIIIIPIITIAILKKEGLSQLLGDIKKIKPKNYINIFAEIAINNASSLIALQILRMISITHYSVLLSSVGSIFTVLISLYIFKETVTKRHLISAALSLVAIILWVL